MVLSRPRVVIWVDGSDQSVAALRWAAAEAHRRQAELVAVYAFGSPRQPLPYPPVHVPLTPDSAAARAVAGLARCIHAAFGGRPPVRLHSICDSRPPVPALLGHARDAALLVLAGQADPARSGGSLDPIVETCLRHSPCPVVLVPAAPTRAMLNRVRTAV